jgi:threonine dehydrogenase-like Zn-dependent dehydrogenase
LKRFNCSLFIAQCSFVIVDGAATARIEKGDIYPSFVTMRHLGFEDMPKGYDLFRNKQDGCIKIVLKS